MKSSVSGPQLGQFPLGLADQGFSVGAMFLVHVMLARTQSKQDYGTFVLSYSLFTFLASLHNAIVLEPYTVFGAGRYRERFPAYSRLMLKSNAIVGAGLGVALLMVCRFLRQTRPEIPLRGLVGLGLTVGIILTGSFLRRTFYIQRQPGGAATASLIFFVTVAAALWTAARNQWLNSFSVFLILGMGWVVAGTMSLRGHRLGSTHKDGTRKDWAGKDSTRKGEGLENEGRRKDGFFESDWRYWREHWGYSRWVLAMSFVFQFMNQGYYWLVAGVVSAKEAGDLKAMYVLIAPVEQVMISLSFLMLPALTGRYAARNFAGFLVLWRRYVVAMAAITVLFALAMRLLGAAAMHVLYVGKFDGLAPLLFPLALVPLATGIGTTFSDAMRAAERPRLVFYAYLSSAIATGVAGVPLVMRLGLRGAVYGMLVSGAAFAGTLAVAFWFHVPRHAAPTWLDAGNHPLASPEQG